MASTTRRGQSPSCPSSAAILSLGSRRSGGRPNSASSSPVSRSWSRRWCSSSASPTDRCTFDSLLTFFQMTPPEGADLRDPSSRHRSEIQVDRALHELRRGDHPRALVIQAMRSRRCGQNGFRRFFCGRRCSPSARPVSCQPQPLRLAGSCGWVRRRPCTSLVRCPWQRADVAPHSMRAMVVLTAGEHRAHARSGCSRGSNSGSSRRCCNHPPDSRSRIPSRSTCLPQGVIATAAPRCGEHRTACDPVLGIVFLGPAAVSPACNSPSPSG